MFCKEELYVCRFISWSGHEVDMLAIRLDNADITNNLEL
jgi:hypothetical protein